MKRRTSSGEPDGAVAAFRSLLPNRISSAASAFRPRERRMSPFWRWRKGSWGEREDAASRWKRASSSLPVSRVDGRQVEVGEYAAPALLEHLREQPYGVVEVSPVEEADSQHEGRVQVPDLEPLVPGVDLQGLGEPPDGLVRPADLEARKAQEPVGPRQSPAPAPRRASGDGWPGGTPPAPGMPCPGRTSPARSPASS